MKSITKSITATLMLLILLIIFKQPPGVLSRRDFDMVFDNCTCVIGQNNEYLESSNCFVGKSIRRRGFTIELLFKKEMKTFSFDLLIELPRKTSNFVLLNLTKINGCDLLSNSKQITLLHISRTMINRYGNFPESCPFKKDHLYYIRSFRMDLDMLPAFTFETSMNIQATMFVKKAAILNLFIQSHTHVTKKGLQAH